MLLNDTITVYFSAPVDPLSVTSDSFAVLDLRGNQVPGRLRVGGTFVTFEPVPPLQPDLQDGSLQPDSEYRLALAGYPRPDGLRAVDGQRLPAAQRWTFRTAATGSGEGLPAPLRPPPGDLPFLLRPAEPRYLPVDAPRLRLDFTLPLLPASVSAAGFSIQLVRRSVVPITPRTVRVVPVPATVAEYPGCTVEIDLGTEPLAQDDGRPIRLVPGDIVVVELRTGSESVVDYAGRPVQLRPVAQFWHLVPGTVVTLFDWPRSRGVVSAENPLDPAFEIVGEPLQVRPRVRVEAGDASLGVLRPQRDLLLRPGLPFDRGDGAIVVSRDNTFPFLAIDIREGIEVRVDAVAGPVQLLVCGGVRIAGALVLDAAPVPLPAPTVDLVPVPGLLAGSPVTLLAAGDVRVTGSVASVLTPAADMTALTIVSAGQIELQGPLPANTLLAFDELGGLAPATRFAGSKGEAIVMATRLTYGVAAGAAFDVAGYTPWYSLPVPSDGGVLRVMPEDSLVRVGWQVASPHPIDPAVPDSRADRIGKPRIATDGTFLPLPLGSFLRLRLEAAVRGDRPLPRLSSLRLLER